MWRSASRLSSSALHASRLHALHAASTRRLATPAIVQAAASPSVEAKASPAAPDDASQAVAAAPRVESQGGAAPPVVESNARDVPPASARATAMSEEEMLASLRAGVAPATGAKLSDIAAEIWEWNTDPVGAGQRSGGKILARPLKGALYASYYPPPPTANKANPFRLSEKQERWREKLRLLRAAGKGPPKKGEGKRKK